MKKALISADEMVKKFEERKKKSEEAATGGGRILDAKDIVEGAMTVADMKALGMEVIASDLKNRQGLLVATAKDLLCAGDVITWKEGLCNRPGLPKSANLMVVTEILLEPLYDENLPMTAVGAREPLDLKVGVIVGNPSNEGQTDFIELLIDSRRVEIWTK